MQTQKFFYQIQNLQNGSQKSQENFIEEFMPIIKKYSKWLAYEDAEQDLIIFFIELLFKYPLKNYKSDAEFISYVSKSFYHQYIKLSIRQQKLNRKFVASFQDDYISDMSEQVFPENKILIAQLFKHLTQTQKRILILKYYHDLNDSDISIKINLSRQTVNKEKNLALQKLKLLIMDGV